MSLCIGQYRALRWLDWPGAQEEGMVASLSSRGTEELLPSHLFRKPTCHCHQHRDKQHRPFKLLSSRPIDLWEGDTGWLDHWHGALEVVGLGRRWPKSKAGPDPQVDRRGFRSGSKPHAWGSMEHVRLGDGFH